MTNPTSKDVVAADRTPRIRGIGTELYGLAAELKDCANATADEITRLQEQNERLATQVRRAEAEIARLRPMAESWESYEAAQDRKAAMRQDETTRDDSAWLIEMAGEHAEPLYWHAEPDMRCLGGFDPDVNKAMRFCREKDARAMALMLGAKGMIALTDVRKVKITEHAWCSSVETSEHPDPAKRCQHDLLKPAHTIRVDGPYDAQCTVCLEEWHIPRPQPLKPTKRLMTHGDDPISGGPMECKSEKASCPNIGCTIEGPHEHKSQGPFEAKPSTGYQTYPGEPLAGIYEAGVGIVRLGKDDELGPNHD